MVKETSGVVATEDTLKNLTSKKIELESIISLEKTRVLDEAKKRDTLKQDLSSIESGLQTWQELSEKMNQDVSRGILAAASDEVKKLVENQDAVQKDIVILFMNVASALDTGPFTEETTISDIQKEYPALKKIAHNKLKSYEDDLKKAEKSREEFITQKQNELKQINLDIERAKYVKQSQLSEAITRVLTYIAIFL